MKLLILVILMLSHLSYREVEAKLMSPVIYLKDQALRLIDLVSEARGWRMGSRLAEYREKSRRRKELLKVTLGVDDLSKALGCEKLKGGGGGGGGGGRRRPHRDSEEEQEGGEGEDRAQFRDSTAFLKGTQSLNPHNDYSQNFVDSGQRPQNFIRDTGLQNRFEEYPKLQELIRLKDELVAETAHPPCYLKCDLESFDLKQLNCKFDTILIEPPLEEYSRTYGVTQTKFWDWDKIMALDIGEVSAARSFVFLWCGSSDGLDLGRLCLQNWGFRRCEDICWIRTNARQSGTGILDPRAVLARTKEHCLMGIKGTVRRSTDGDFIHANVDIDLIIDEEPVVGSLDKPVEMFHIAEHFCLGRRRLHVFGRDSCIRPGWLTIGPDLSNSNYDWALHQGYFTGPSGLTTGCTDRIEQLRPKSPPPKAGQRGRGGKRRGGRGARGGKGSRS